MYFGIYGTKLKVHRGKVQTNDYLGIILDYSEDGKVKISMIKYIIKMIHRDMKNLIPLTNFFKVRLFLANSRFKFELKLPILLTLAF